MPPDLTGDDKAALSELLRETFERDRFPLSPRDQDPTGDPRQARRRLNPGRTALPAAEAAGRAEHGAGEEAAEIEVANSETVALGSD
jgi:hypothetical protein